MQAGLVFLGVILFLLDRAGGGGGSWQGRRRPPPLRLLRLRLLWPVCNPHHVMECLKLRRNCKQAF